MKGVDLFSERCGWGLRGDPVLWEKLKEKAENLDFSTKSDFTTWLYSSIQEWTGLDFKTTQEEIVFVEAFQESRGLSSGEVSIHGWQVNVIPFLLRKWELNGRKP